MTPSLTAVLFWASFASAVPQEIRAPSLEECTCAYLTNDPFQPTKMKKYSSDSYCGINGFELYFSCEDAEAILATQCYCVEPGESRKPDLIKRYRSAAECNSLGASSPSPEGRVFVERNEQIWPGLALFRCEDIPEIVKTPKDRCFCLNPTKERSRPYQLIRFNWAPECLAVRYGPEDPPPSPSELLSCADASDRMGRCLCSDEEGVRKFASDPECDGMKYVGVDRKDGKGLNFDVPPCKDFLRRGPR